MTGADVGYRAIDRHQLRTDTRLPVSTLGRDVHSELTAMPVLLEFLRTNADRTRRLIRPPYALVRESAPDEPRPPVGRRRPWDADVSLHDMRMPPYMRDSDASPLSLSRRQYVQLMSLVDHLTATAGAGLLAADAESLAGQDPEELFRAFRLTDLTADVPEAPREPRP